MVEDIIKTVRYICSGELNFTANVAATMQTQEQITLIFKRRYGNNILVMIRISQSQITLYTENYHVSYHLINSKVFPGGRRQFQEIKIKDNRS